MFSQFFTAILAQDVAAPKDQGLLQMLIMGVVFAVFFYFILWRPEQKRRKAQEDQQNAVKKGDRVVAMGIIGTVVKVTDNTLILKMYDGSKIEVLKVAVNDVTPGTEEDAKKMDKEEKKLIEITEIK